MEAIAIRLEADAPERQALVGHSCRRRLLRDTTSCAKVLWDTLAEVSSEQTHQAIKQPTATGIFNSTNRRTHDSLRLPRKFKFNTSNKAQSIASTTMRADRTSSCLQQYLHRTTRLERFRHFVRIILLPETQIPLSQRRDSNRPPCECQSRHSEGN